MKIKTQVSISLIIFALLAVVIIFSVYSSNNQLQDIQTKQQIIDNIETSSSELYYLENDYIVYGGTIPAKRWNAKYVELTGYIQALKLTDPSQQAVLNQMFDGQNELNKSFSNLVALTSSGQGTGSGGVSQELKEFSASTLGEQTQMLMSRSSELSHMVKAESHDVEQRTNLIISFSIAVLILFVLLNYLVINRSVLRSISELQNGAERIESGELDTKIEKTGDDELGYLSRTFNEMASSINDSHSLLLASNEDLEQEIIEHKRAEEALRERDYQIQALIDNLPFDTWAMDASGQYILQNPVSKKLWGDCIGKTTPRIPVPAYLIEHWQENNRKVLTGTSIRGELLISSENKVRIYDEIVAPIRIGDEIHGIIGVNIDITDRKLAEDTIFKVNKKLNVLSQLTRQDLNTQIFILNSYLEMAKKQATGQDGIIKNIESGERIVRAINEITEFTKDYHNLGEKPPVWQNVKLAFLFGFSHISIGEIRYSLETENLEIFADPLLEKAFQGLLENSVSHGGYVSCIRVWHNTTPDGVTILFEDDGIGIPTETKEQIFLRGEGERASVRGLFFVREILDITGITIRETGEPGKGVRFEMKVPKGSYRMNPDTPK